MAGFVGNGFAIQSLWKETVHYWEGPRGYSFEAGWGVEPPVLYVPAPGLWDACVPEWMHGRRDLIVARLDAHSGHTVVDSMSFDPETCDQRILSRPLRSIGSEPPTI